MFKRMLSMFFAVLVLSSLSLAGCSSSSNPVVTITYKQVGACNGYETSNGGVSVGPNAAYVIFAVDTIDNSQSSQDFAFDPTHLFVNLGGQHVHIDTSLSLAHDILGTFTLVPTTIPAGKTVTLDGFAPVVVTTVAANGASEANKTSYFLLSDPSPNFGFILVKSNPSQTSWPDTENCRDIQLSA